MKQGIDRARQAPSSVEAIKCFSKALNDAYGYFQVRTNNYGSASAYWQTQAGSILPSAQIKARSLDVSRARNALRPEHEDTLFIMIQQYGQLMVEHCDQRTILRRGDVIFLNALDMCRLVSADDNQVLVAHVTIDQSSSAAKLRDQCGISFPGNNLRTQMCSDVVSRLCSPRTNGHSEDTSFELTILNTARRDRIVGKAGTNALHAR